MRLYHGYLVDWCDQWFYVWLSVYDGIFQDMSEIGWYTDEHTSVNPTTDIPIDCRVLFSLRNMLLICVISICFLLCYWNKSWNVEWKPLYTVYSKIDVMVSKPRYHQTTNTSLRCSWSIACWRCSNNIFILDLAPGFRGLGKDNCKTRRETFKFSDLVRLT